MNMKLILASRSPRRRELIKLLGLPYECVSVETDERTASTDPAAAVCEISAQKAEAVLGARGLRAGEVIIGADTVVAYGGRILGKPADENDARQTLRLLSGQTHCVYTGITLIGQTEENRPPVRSSFSEATEVHFLPLSGREIDRYLATGEYADKAGSYAIQGVFSVHVSGICGDYQNVVGFPVSRLYRELCRLFPDGEPGASQRD